MTLAPERISIKRRRQEEPVETLYLEQSSAPDRKRRVTDFYFQRVQIQVPLVAPLSQPSTGPHVTRPASSGVPSVRTSAPGDNVRDYNTLREAWRAKSEEDAPKRHGGVSQGLRDSQNAGNTKPVSTSAEVKDLQQLRRFHLARHLSTAPSGGLERKKIDIRPPLATFVERRPASNKHEKSSIYQGEPVDKVINLPHDRNGATLVAGVDEPPSLAALQTSDRTPIKPFVAAEAHTKRKGTSIQDHPSTWDHDSDQLADELAALAMEFDPEIQNKAVEPEAAEEIPILSTAVEEDLDRMILDDNDFVYETYIKVQQEQGGNPITNMEDWAFKVGVLVIDEEDEDLWNKYVDSDEEDDWDEEDSNAEDNPSNDYPEDEVSSDDQFSRNPYKYRQYDSDNEYDDDYL
ncbi:hypothetical protein LTR84_006121 [Exophiala bonariae]|uniref:Transcription factor Iwr1 domain-containing protein n=1 Tax=Exophiala bonariae TaxID=1690606 RepID=A0AAV9N5J1_9EURO|nr:hypothetical protein LTR84_006121 [Exophiala bonariae]